MIHDLGFAPWAPFEGLAYNRVAMTSYFQHRSATELALTSLEWLEEKGVDVIFARATAVTPGGRA